MLDNYCVADDFTWFRWIAEGGTGWGQIWNYFTVSDGFFYRPGTKTFFSLMYPIFWLNPAAYHVVSLVVHTIVVLLVFVLSRKVLQNFGLAVLASFLFVMLSSYHEAVFWISSIGHLVSVMFALLSLLFFTLWDEKKNIFYFIGTLVCMTVGLLFQELAVIAPLLIIFYKFTADGFTLTNIKLKKLSYGLLFSPVIFYLIVRFFANSHWSGGDYTYNLLKLPFNIVGNSLGYFLISFMGPMSLNIYDALRNIFRDNLFIAALVLIAVAACAVPLYRLIKRFNKEDKRIVIFSLGFMLISVLPFLGLGNITSRYTYLLSFGFVILFVFLIKKLYTYLLSYGRDIAVSVVILFLSIFFLLHIIQTQKIHDDWHEAGLKVNRFFVGIEGAYLNYWSTEPMQLTFVDQPVKTGEAWVFPTGMNDALWFIFKNPDMTLHQYSSVEDALSAVTNVRNQKVFLFDGSGSVTEQKKRWNDIPNPE
jgi:hypothetical protein